MDFFPISYLEQYEENNLHGLEKRAVTSVLTYYLFSSVFQKFEKKIKLYALERSRKLFSVGFCCNIKCFLPTPFWDLSGILSLKAVFTWASIRAEESKLNWYFYDSMLYNG